MRRASYYIDAGTRNAEVVNALGMIDNLAGRWQKLNDDVIDTKICSDTRGKTMQGVTKYLRMVLQIIMLATGAWLVIPPAGIGRGHDRRYADPRTGTGANRFGDRHLEKLCRCAGVI